MDGYEVWFVKRGKKGRIRNVEELKVEQVQEWIEKKIEEKQSLVSRIVDRDLGKKIAFEFMQWYYRRLREDRNRKRK